MTGSKVTLAGGERKAIHPKRKAAQYLRAAPVLVEEVSEVSFR